MPSKALQQGSSSVSKVLSHLSPSVTMAPRSFFKQFMMTIIVSVLLIGFLPSVKCSPTPLSNPIETNNNNNKINNYDSNALMFDANEYHPESRQDSSSLSSSVHEQPFLEPSSSLWYAEPRTHANQFLMSHVNHNDGMAQKWLSQLNNNNDDDIDDYLSSGILVNKRSPYYTIGGYSSLSKRKQIAKPPMEVMNEIVNSIYLKR